MTLPLISATLAGFVIILQQLLMLNTGIHRGKTGIGVGTNGDLHLERKMRRHGNLAESSGLFLVVLALTEIIGAPSGVILGFAAVFAVARVAHATGFSSLAGSHKPGENKLYLRLRFLGAIGTVFGGVALGGYLLYMLFAMR